MVTTIIKTINPDGSADYTTLQAWVNGRKGNLVTRDTVEIAELTGSTYFTEGCTIATADWTVDSTHYIQIRAATGAEHGGCFRRVGACIVPQTVGLDISVAGTLIGPGLSIYPDLDTGNPSAVYIHDISQDVPCIVDGIIVHQYGPSSPGIHIENCSGATGHCVKNYVFMNATGSAKGIRVDGASSVLTAYNSTIISDDRCIHISGGATVTENNNYFYSDNTVYSGSGTFNKGVNSMTNNNEAVTVVNRGIGLTTTNFLFINHGSPGFHEGQLGIEDWHIPATSALKGAGADLSAITPVSFRPTVGIDRQTRTTWDVGADEYTVPTTITKTIGSGKDYSTLAAWVIARKGNLAIRDTVEVAEVYGAVGSVELNEADWAVNTKNYVQIKAASGQHTTGVFDTGHAYIKAGASSSKPAIKCYVGGTIIGPGLTIDSDGSGASNETCIELGGESAAPIIIEENFLRSTSAGSPFLITAVGLINYNKQQDAVLAHYVRSPVVVKSCILLATACSSGIGLKGTSGVWNVWNNTIVVNDGSSSIALQIDPWAGISQEQNNYLKSKTCYSLDANGTKGANSATNTAEAATSGYRNITLSSAGFTNITTGSEDFHLLSTSVLVDQGADLSAQGVTTDIDGETRPGSPLFDIGADEFQHVPVCWNYVARYKSSNKLFRVSGCGPFPKRLRVPLNVNVSTGRMIDDGQLIYPNRYEIVQ